MTELRELSRSCDLAEIQKMPPGLDYDRSCTGLLQRGVLGDEVLALDDVAAWPGDVQELQTRFRLSCFRQMLQSDR